MPAQLDVANEPKLPCRTHLQRDLQHVGWVRVKLGGGLDWKAGGRHWEAAGRHIDREPCVFTH